MDELSPETEAKDMKLAATRTPGRVGPSYHRDKGTGRRLEHQEQAPIGGAEDCRARRQKAGGRRVSLGVSAGARRKEDAAPILRPRKTGVLRGEILEDDLCPMDLSP